MDSEMNIHKQTEHKIRDNQEEVITIMMQGRYATVRSSPVAR